MLLHRLAIVIVFVALGACSSSGQSGSDEYGFFFKPHDHVEELLDRGRTWEAASVYDKEEAYFTDKADTKSVQKVVARLDSSVSAEFTEMLTQRRWSNINVNDRANWSRLKKVFASYSGLYNKSSRHRILYENKNYKNLINQAASNLSALRQQFETSAATLFADSAWRADDFFDEYPIQLSKAATITGAWANLTRRMDYKSFEDNVDLWNHYQNELSDNQVAFLSRYLWENSCPSKSKKGLMLQLCRVDTLADHDLLRHKELAAQISVAFVSVLPTGVKVDWGKFKPLAAAPSDVGTIKNPKDYIVLLGSEKGKELDRREKTSQRISSQYLLITKTLPNSAYITQQARVSQAQAQVGAANTRYSIAQAQSNSCYGTYCTSIALQALGASIALVGQRKKLNAEIEKLSRMSPTIEDPVYENYQITQTDYDLIKSAMVKVVVYDNEGRIIKFRPLQVDETKELTVYYNVHEKERYKSKYRETEQDVAQYFEEDLKFEATGIWDRLPESQIETTKRGTFQTAYTLASARAASGLPTGKSTTSTVGNEPGKYSSLLNSVVIVSIPNISIAAGFFIGPDLILTNHHAVEETRFVDIILSDGTSTFGKVLRSSPHTDLALIQVNGSGEPVKFHSGQFGVGDDVVAVGHPKGLQFSVTRGIVSSIRSGPVGESNSPPVKLVQTDTALNTGNSGGPLFLDGKVIGIITMGFRKDVSEGLSFAVHVEEIKKFLSQ